MDLQQKMMIAKNLKHARKLAGYELADVMRLVYGGDGSNKNRISEIETGHTLPRFDIFCSLCNLYGVSADYVLGRSVEPEIDATAGRVNILYGYVMESVGELVHSMADQLCRAGEAHLAMMPKPSALALSEAAKALYQAFCATDRARLMDDYPSLVQAILGLSNVAREFDRSVAVARRDFEMRMADVVQRDDVIDGHVMQVDLMDDVLKKPCKVRPRKKVITVNDTPQMSLLVVDNEVVT